MTQWNPLLLKVCCSITSKHSSTSRNHEDEDMSFMKMWCYLALAGIGDAPLNWILMWTPHHICNNVDITDMSQERQERGPHLFFSWGSRSKERWCRRGWWPGSRGSIIWCQHPETCNIHPGSVSQATLSMIFRWYHPTNSLNLLKSHFNERKLFRWNKENGWMTFYIKKQLLNLQKFNVSFYKLAIFWTPGVKSSVHINLILVGKSQWGTLLSYL